MLLADRFRRLRACRDGVSWIRARGYELTPEGIERLWHECPAAAPRGDWIHSCGAV
jgi:hypothetical protein